MLIQILILPNLVNALLPTYRPPRLPVVTSDNAQKDSVSSQQKADSSPNPVIPDRLSLNSLPSTGNSSLSLSVGPSTSLPGQSSSTEVSTVRSDKPTRQESRWKDHLKKGKGRKDRKNDSDRRRSDSDKRRKSSYYELPDDRYDPLTGMSIPIYPQREPPSSYSSRPVSNYPSSTSTVSTSSTTSTTTTTTAAPSLVPKPNLVETNRSLIAEVRHSVPISKPNQELPFVFFKIKIGIMLVHHACLL